MSDVRVDLPYGHEFISITVPDTKLMGVYTPRSLAALPDPAGTIRAAVAQPDFGPPLRELVKDAGRISVVIEDATRPVPNALLINALMQELSAGGVSANQVTVIVATGLHRPMTDEEVRLSLGPWYGQIVVENHSAQDEQRLNRLGTTSLGTEISVNRTFLEADVKITTGDVEYHQFCGYGGGAKCVYPGLADAEAIRANHSRMDLPGTGPGRLDDNPVRREIDEVGRMAGVDFNVSLAMDASHQVVAVSAGDPDQSFRHVCQFIDQMYLIEVPRRADLVIASPGGFPKDMNLYQSQKAIEEATQVVTPRGDVLITARCEEGSGSTDFEDWMEAAQSPEDIIDRIRTNFVMGGHKAYQIAREVQRANIHLLSEITPSRVRGWMMQPVVSASHVRELVAAAETVIVLPQATLVRACVTGC